MAGQAEIGALRVRLAMDAGKFEKSTKRAQRSVKGLEKSFAGLKTRAASALGGLLGGAAFAGLVRGAQKAAAEFDKFAKAADTRGLNTDFYQTLQLAAEEAGVKQELLNSSLTAFAKRVGEARAGTGPLASTLRKMNESLFEAVKNSTSQEEALRLLADAMQTTTDAADRAALASSAFSRAGVDMVRILRDGQGAFDRTAQKARELGIMVDEQLLRNMEQVNNDFGVATRVIDLQFKQALIAAAPLIKDFAEGLASVAQSLRLFFEGLRPLSERSSFALEEGVRSTRAELEQVNTALDQLREKKAALEASEGGLFTFKDTNLRSVELSIAALLERRGELEGMFTRTSEALASARLNAEALRQAVAPGDDGQGLSTGFTTETVQTQQLATETQQAWNAAVQMGVSLVQQTQGPLEIYRQQIEALKAAQAEGEISAAGFARAQSRAAALVANQYVGLASTVGGALESVFQESKGVAIASAIVNSLQAFTAALANPPGPPFSYAQAAAALASGYAQVQRIRSQCSSGSCGGGASASPAAGAGQAAAQPAQQVQAANITIQGDSFSRDSIERLIEGINDATGDGVRLNATVRGA